MFFNFPSIQQILTGNRQEFLLKLPVQGNHFTDFVTHHVLEHGLYPIFQGKGGGRASATGSLEDNTDRSTFRFVGLELDVSTITGHCWFHIFLQNIDDLLKGVYKTEKRIRRKWHNEDKVAMGISFGLAYPALRKIHKNESKMHNNELNSLKNNYHAAESFKSEIVCLKNKLEKTVISIEKVLNKRQKEDLRLNQIIRV